MIGLNFGYRDTRPLTKAPMICYGHLRWNQGIGDKFCLPEVMPNDEIKPWMPNLTTNQNINHVLRTPKINQSTSITSYTLEFTTDETELWVPYITSNQWTTNVLYTIEMSQSINDIMFCLPKMTNDHEIEFWLSDVPTNQNTINVFCTSEINRSMGIMSCIPESTIDEIELWAPNMTSN